jgi:hypothetical protein
VNFSLDALTGFSFVPLRLATTLGFVLAGLSLVGILIAAVLRLVEGAIVGQASTLILVLLLGGIQLIFLGILGEYLGRIYDEVRARPLYIAREVPRASHASAPSARPQPEMPQPEVPSSEVPQPEVPQSRAPLITH